MKTFCVKVKREIEEPYIFHFKWNKEENPKYDEVEKMVFAEDIRYNPDYEKFSFWLVDENLQKIKP